MTSPTTRMRQAANCARVNKANVDARVVAENSCARIIPAADSQTMLDQRAHHVPEEYVRLLDARGFFCRDDDRQINHATELTAVAAKQPDGCDADRLCHLDRADYVGRIAG